MAGLRRGDVRWYRFVKPDKKRPVVILTRDSAVLVLGEVTVAPITSTVRGIPSEVFLTQADGLPRDCAVNLDHLQTVTKSRIGSLITTLNREQLGKVSEALSFALDLG